MRGKMTQRAVVQRNTAAGADDWGNVVKPTFTTHQTIPCYAFVKTRVEKRGDDKDAVVTDFRALFPEDADITSQDKITSIQDRLGVVIFPGPIAVETIAIKPGHKEAMLRANL